MLQTVNVPNEPNIFHHGRTSLYNIYNTLTLTLINNGHYLSIVLYCHLVGQYTPKFQKVTGISPFEMVYHIEPQICSIYKLGKTGIN